ncbi:MAG: DUF4105 domain-containing protein [Bacteroidaceae bacterium]|nr:DUF4105 domain-containing protein [Bacteroidaceae bacterium]
MTRLLTILLSLFLTLTAQAQEGQKDSIEASLPTDVYAYYVVVTPGEKMSAILGHAAVRVSCPSAGLDYCFTIKTPEIKDEAIDMLFGRLRIGVVPEETAMFRHDYIKDGRGITEYRLNLTLDETRQLWKMLDDQVARGLYMNLDYVNNSCTQVAFENIYELLRVRSGMNIDHIISQSIPVKTRREAVLNYFDQSTWWGFLLHSCYSYHPDEEVSPRRLVVMPQDAATVLYQAGMVSEETEIAKQESPSSSKNGWFTPLVASILFLVLCLLPFKQIDYLAVPLWVVLMLLFVALSIFASSAGIGFNWLILALFPFTAPVGIVYMLCHMGDIYSLSQLLVVLAFFTRSIYMIYRNKEKLTINIHSKKQKDL